LYVLLHHCCQIYQEPDAVPRYGYYAFIPWLLRGRAVAVFMVLSGFLLMMPVTKSPTGHLPDGFLSYLKRRIRRIVPPYYAALAFSLLCIAIVPNMNRGSGEFWGRALPAFGWANLLSHLLLLHGLSPAWVYKINPPIWTLATEWLLYFIFPAILLPVWRRFGTLTLLVFGIVIGFAPRILLRNTAWTFNWVSPWFIGLFAMGMAGAVLQTSPRAPSETSRLRKLFCGPLGAIGLAIAFCLFLQSRVAMDYVFGAATLWLILYCGRTTNGASLFVQQPLLKLLQSKLLQRIGNISYSIYLIHGPVLMLIYRSIDHTNMSANARAAIMFLIAPAITLGAAWVFHRLVEQPLLPAVAQKPATADASAIPTPLPPAMRRRPLKRRASADVPADRAA
jgi:peptidoglycan/LPS O-acetylase OafA/YrhL